MKDKVVVAWSAEAMKCSYNCQVIYAHCNDVLMQRLIDEGFNILTVHDSIEIEIPNEERRTRALEIVRGIEGKIYDC